MLDEPTPRRPVQPAPVAAAGPTAGDLGRLLVARWPSIAALACAGAIACYGGSFLIAPSYTATTSIFVDPRSIQALDMKSGPSQPDNNAEVSFVESQARIVTSEGVLGRVVDGEHLAEDPEFGGGGHDTLLARVPSLIGLRPTEAPGDSAERQRAAALAALYDRVAVRRPERTFIMDVSVKARGAEKAARLANAVADAYFAEQAAVHADMARRASDMLTSRLQDLRERVRQAEQRAQAFRLQQGLIGTRTQLSSEQQLTDANAQLAQARSRVVLAQARLEEARRSIDGPNEGTTPEAVASPTVMLLRGQQAEANRRLANALAQFGPLHPAVRDAQSEVAGLTRAVKAELSRIAQAAHVDYDRAVAAEKAQQAIVERLSGDAASTSQALMQLSQLEREVDINKDLLNTFLSRARETGELEQVDQTTARVISKAQPPLYRSFPPRGVVFLAIGALLGGAIGALLTLRNALPLPRAPGRPAELDASAPRRYPSAGVRRSAVG